VIASPVAEAEIPASVVTEVVATPVAEVETPEPATVNEEPVPVQPVIARPVREQPRRKQVPAKRPFVRIPQEARVVKPIVSGLSLTKGKPSAAMVEAMREITRSRIASSKPIANPRSVAILDPDAEEITLVRAPKTSPIRIDIVKPTPSRTRTDDIAFFPTMLGNASDRNTPASIPTDSIFANFDEPSESNVVSSYRSIAIVACVVIAVAVVMFGSSSMNRFLQSSSSADSVADARVPSSAKEPTIVAPASTEKKTRAVTAVAEKEKPDPERKAPKAEDVAKTTTKAKSISSQKPVSAAEADGKSRPQSKAETKVVPAPSKKTGATRPRIVDVP
jgi:hypothetical protein